MALSILPFLAQGRALYIVLVYHQSSPEVSGSLLLLFGVGSIILIAAFLLDEQASIAPALAKLLGSKDPVDDGAPELRDAREVAPLVTIVGEPTDSAIDMTSPKSIKNPVNGIAAPGKIRAELDEDLHRERRRAEQYVRNKEVSLHGHHSGPIDVEVADALTADEQARLAIVLKEMKFKFPPRSGMPTVADLCGSTSDVAGRDAGPVFAVNGLSLALSLGECFGLLGPNGAGATTVQFLRLFPLVYAIVILTLYFM